MDFILAYFLQKIIPYLGFFPYKEILVDYHLPSFISSFANFDGVHYLILAKQGYSQYEHAFFPLYFLLIKLLTPVFFGNALLTGLIISNVGFLLGLIIFYKYLRMVFADKEARMPVFRDLSKLRLVGGERRGAPTSRTDKLVSEAGAGARQNLPAWVIFFLLVFPTSFFFSAIYTEGLFFFLFIASLYFLKKALPAGRQEKYLFLAAIFAFLASLTRLTGVFLIIPFAFSLVKPSTLNVKRLTLNVESLKKLLFLLSPLFGLLAYGLFLYFTTGDPLAFFSSQPAFGANRSTRLIFLPQVYYRYIKIFITAAPDFRYWVSVFEFVVFNFVLFVLTIDFLFILKRVKTPVLRQSLGGPPARSVGVKRSKNTVSNPLQDLLGLSLFSIINLVLPTLTGTLSSIPRYALFSLSFFIALAQIKSTVVKIVLVIFMAIFHLAALGLFIQGYFIA